MTDYNKIWDDFFIHHGGPGIIEVKSFNEVTASKKYLHLSNDKKIEFVNYILDNWDTFSPDFCDPLDDPSIAKLLFKESLKWQKHLRTLERDIETDSINQERIRIENKLETIKDVEDKIVYLEGELKELEQNALAVNGQILGFDNLYKIIQSEIKYWESVEKRTNLPTEQKPNSIDKIKWTGKPSHLAYILSSLIKRKDIELPVEIPEGNFTKVGQYFWQRFDIIKCKNEHAFIRSFQGNTSISDAIQGDLDKIIDQDKQD